MTTLETLQAAQARLATAQAAYDTSPTDTTRADLERAQAAAATAARNQRREEILAMPAGSDRDALLAPLGADLEPVDLPTQAEIDKARARRRAQAYEDLRDELFAQNRARVRSGEVSSADMSAWLESAEMQLVFTALRALSFEVAATRIAALTSPLATAEVKADWVGRLQGY